MEKVKLEFSTTMAGRIIRILNNWLTWYVGKNPTFDTTTLKEAIEYMTEERNKVLERNEKLKEKRKEVFTKLLEKYTLEEIEKL